MTKNLKKTILIILALLAWTTISYIACQFLVVSLFKLILSEKIIQTFWLTICEIVSYLATIGVTLFFPQLVCKKYQTNKQELGLDGSLSWTGLLLAPAGFIIYAALAAIVSQLFSIFPWFDVNQVQNVGIENLSNAPERLCAFLTLVVIAPIVEEVIFRGWLYGKIRKTLPAKTSSIVITSLIVSVLFGILHFQWNVSVNVFCLSLVLCALRELTGNIYSGILLHMIKNGIAFYLLWIL